MALAETKIAEYPQGSVKPYQLVSGPSAWYAEDYKDLNKAIYHLTASDVAELDAAVTAVAGTKDIATITQADFELPTLGPVLRQLLDEVENGRGFVLIRGVPVQRYSRRETVIAYWGLGLYWGKALPQNKKGHLVGHIKDLGLDPANPQTRLYATHAAQPYHNDASDVVGLLCLKNAREGGLSSWSSSIAVHNEIVRRYPHLAPVLAGPWYFDRKGEVPEGKKPYFMIPVFNYHEGYLSVNFSSNYFFLSQRHADVPRLTDLHLEAIRRFEELAQSDKLRLDYLLQPGDIQLLSNHTVLHSRTAFTDFPDIDKRRHLLRLWLSPEDSRPLPQTYSEILGGSVQPGKRGGIRIDGFSESIPLEAE